MNQKNSQRAKQDTIDSERVAEIMLLNMGVPGLLRDSNKGRSFYEGAALVLNWMLGNFTNQELEQELFNNTDNGPDLRPRISKAKV